MEQKAITLDEVKSHFEHWRATRSKLRERIPQHLWDEVKTIFDRYPLAEIIKSLRINTYQIKDNLKISPKIHFAEARIDNSTLLSNYPISSYTDKIQNHSIELHRTNGVVLKINALSMLSIQKIITQFME